MISLTDEETKSYKKKSKKYDIYTEKDLALMMMMMMMMMMIKSIINSEIIVIILENIQKLLMIFVI